MDATDRPHVVYKRKPVNSTNSSDCGLAGEWFESSFPSAHTTRIVNMQTHRTNSVEDPAVS